jgi:hypothetical protein
MDRAKWSFRIAVVACALVLAGCAGEDDERDAIGSHLQQPPAGTRRPPPTDAGDIALVGQDVAHAIVQLPEIANATVPPLVRFNGVTSIIVPPIDTAPYTGLLRDRLLLLTREKLRFIEHTLPPYVPGGHKKHGPPSVAPGDSDAQYEVLAEMRGKADADAYKIQVEFVEIGSGNVLFNETFRIAKESEGQPSASEYTSPMAPPPSAPSPTAQPGATGQTPQAPPPGYYDPPANKSTGPAGVL